MSNQTAPGHTRDANPSTSDPLRSVDPLLRNGSFIDPTSNLRRGGGEIPIKSNGHYQQATPQAPPSSSGNGTETGTASRTPRKGPAPPVPGSDTASWLPSGWLVEDRVRISGATAGTVDKFECSFGLKILVYVLGNGESLLRSNGNRKEGLEVPNLIPPFRAVGMINTRKYYIESTTGRRFRSKKDVQYYLETGTVKKRKRGMEKSDADINSSESSESQKNKKFGTTTTNVNFDYSNVPDRTEWVLTDAKEDIWTPFIGGNKVPETEKQAWDAAFDSLSTTNSGYKMFEACRL